MIVETLTDSLVSPVSDLGPYRRGDYLRLPDEPRCELLFGRIYVTPSPTFFHQAVVIALSRRLQEIAAAAGGAVTVAPLDVTLADHTVVQPDVIYVSKERLGIIHDRIEGAPDLLVEVISPATARRDRGEKLKAYAEAGVREYWIVEPGVRHIEFLVNRGSQFQVALPLDGVYRSAVLPEITLDLEAFWREVEALLPGGWSGRADS